MNTTPETDALEKTTMFATRPKDPICGEALLHARKMERQRGELAERLREEQRLHIRTLNERDELRHQIRETLMENLHLADGEDCTLRRLKDAIGFDLQDENQTTPMP